jgi:hypothetical protein
MGAEGDDGTGRDGMGWGGEGVAVRSWGSWEGGGERARRANGSRRTRAVPYRTKYVA